MTRNIFSVYCYCVAKNLHFIGNNNNAKNKKEFHNHNVFYFITPPSLTLISVIVDIKKFYRKLK
jgi:hypothetical protein